MSDTNPHISEEQARELWRRALQLQNAAEREAPEPHALVPASRGLSLDQVAGAAEAAGIDADYVRYIFHNMTDPRNTFDTTT